MKYLNSYKLFESLKVDTKDINDIFLEIIDLGYHYELNMEYDSFDDYSKLEFRIGHNKRNVVSTDDISDVVLRLTDYMKSNEYYISNFYGEHSKLTYMPTEKQLLKELKHGRNIRGYFKIEFSNDTH